MMGSVNAIAESPRGKLRLRGTSWLALFVVALIVNFTLSPVYFGDAGSFTDRQSGSMVAFHPTCYVWLHEGQTVTFSYSARTEGHRTYVSYNFYQWFAEWPISQYIGSLNMFGSVSGQNTFTAPSTALYTLEHESPLFWKGDVQITWHVGPH